ncbi:unnamed protein product, partial [marine sediment metagenome]
MTVREIWIDGTKINVTGEGYIPEGEFKVNGQKISLLDDELLN